MVRELISTLTGAPAGVKAFLAGCVLLVIICTACAIAEAVNESRNDERRYRHGHAD